MKFVVHNFAIIGMVSLRDVDYFLMKDYFQMEKGVIVAVFS